MNKSDTENNTSLVKQEDLPPGVLLRDHVVDGIQEYDQRLPNWWLVILFGMLGFSTIYWIVTDQHGYRGKEDAKLESKLAAIQTVRLANSIDVSNDDLFWDMSANASFVSSGKATFEANCVACHGQNLEGGIGFNLVDAEWIHGARPSEIYVSVSEGFPEKGMLPWEPLLGQKRIAEVVAYVLSRNDRDVMQAAAASAAEVLQ
ncbi:MAG: c-type cytochrome [Verrucomicrobiota bacterium]